MIIIIIITVSLLLFYRARKFFIYDKQTYSIPLKWYKVMVPPWIKTCLVHSGNGFVGLFHSTISCKGMAANPSQQQKLQIVQWKS